MSYEKDPSEIGALWIKTGSRGEYFSGSINGVPVVVFKNDKKAPGSKGPDYRVLKPTPKPQASVPSREPGDDDIGF